jgi:hypothetical protein
LVIKEKTATLTVLAMIARSIGAANRGADHRRRRGAHELNFARDESFDGDAANVSHFDIDVVFVKELFVFGNPERQHGAADRAVGDAHGRGVGDIADADRQKERE